MSHTWKRWSALWICVVAAGCEVRRESEEEMSAEAAPEVGPASVELESNTVRVRYRFTNPTGSPVLALMDGVSQRYGMVTTTSCGTAWARGPRWRCAATVGWTPASPSPSLWPPVAIP